MKSTEMRPDTTANEETTKLALFESVVVFVDSLLVVPVFPVDEVSERSVKSTLWSSRRSEV